MKLTPEQEEVRRVSPKGKQFGPEPHQFDPYDGMTDEEFQTVVDEAMAAAKTVPISIRLPRRVIANAKAEAERRGMPYQTLLRTLIELGLDRAS